jgi:PadR family transcriptional regulator, regulatory protein PadR
MNELAREILLSIWKIHILHHAGEHPVYGQWIMGELRRHGHDVSPGTLYPMLRRMERLGLLERVDKGPRTSRNARQEYVLAPAGAEVLAVLRASVAELHEELAGESVGHGDGEVREKDAVRK